MQHSKPAANAISVKSKVCAVTIILAIIASLLAGLKINATNTPEPIKGLYTDEAAAPAPMRQPTIEDMLASGYITDEITLSYELQIAAREASKAFDISYKLLIAVMYHESRYKPDVVNYNETCFGLMQIHKMNFNWLEETLKDYGVTDIKNNPIDNIKAGAYMLGSFYDKYNDYHKTLMCYSCGEYRAKSLWKNGCTSTKYSRKVLETRDMLNVFD